MTKIKVLLTVFMTLSGWTSVYARSFNRIPDNWKWLSNKELVFTYDGSFSDSEAFRLDVISRSRKALSYSKPVSPDFKADGAVNLTFSPDSSKAAYTKGNDLYVTDLASGIEKRLTFDGSALILNGYASWIYYEEILGRSSAYKAFWWSPDSKKLAFFRFDNSKVPVFPIYSPFGQGGVLHNTRYPKAGQPNPEVKIGFIDISKDAHIVWAELEAGADEYFGPPFWGPDSEELFVSREPREQNTLELFKVSHRYGSKIQIYKETYSTWLDWIDKVLFTSKGLYMVRSFESLWQQVYFLSYDGKEFRRLTEGENWRIDLIAADEKKGDVFYTAVKGENVRRSLYKVSKDKKTKLLTDSGLDVSKVKASPDKRRFAVQLSNYTTPSQIWVVDADKPLKNSFMVADMRGEDYKEGDYALPRLMYMTTKDGLRLPAAVTLPKNFDPSSKYPVHMYIYGGPDSPVVKDRWTLPDADSQWWSENGIIHVVADCRAAGHNGRAGLDKIYKRLGEIEAKDFVEWAEYFKAMPYVLPDKIGVEGFSFGGTMTAMLVMRHSDSFPYGVAGGGVYDWALYDTHYTERFMGTPETNPEGYAASKVISFVPDYPADFSYGEGSLREPVMLRLTHGTGDDNVHFQNTLLLADALQRHGKKFELMIYPDGMHGYRGHQKEHFSKSNKDFWLKYLKGK